jgi:hypothetical protein
MCDRAGVTMTDQANGHTEDTQAEREAAVALGVAWLVALARAFRIDGAREVRLDKEIRAAQVDLIQVIRLACAGGVTVEDLRARFIDPVVRQPGIHGGAALLLAETARLVEEEASPGPGGREGASVRADADHRTGPAALP